MDKESDIVTENKARISSRRNFLVAFAILAITVLTVLVFHLVRDNISEHIAEKYVNDVTEVYNINKYLGQAISIVVALVLLFFADKFGTLKFFADKFGASEKSKAIAIGGITSLLLIYYLLMAYGTNPHIFDPKGNPIKCYVLTRDGGVRWLEPIAVDPITGRDCQKPTAEMAERLASYVQGKRPQRLGDEEIDFFDPRTREPIVWYWQAKSGEIEIFNLMGFHPESGKELLPITPDIVEKFKLQRAQRRQILQKRQSPPKKIDPETYVFFDPATGESRGWYWRNNHGVYEFYDNSGFHPQTGEQLKPVDNAVLTKWRAEKKEAEARQAAERLKQEHEAQLQADRQERERQAAVERERQEAQAGVTCDQLASNPSDPHRSGEVTGVRYDELRAQATDAVQACRIAREKFPHEPRYKYQFARALEINDPNAAIPLYRQLIGQNYPAAYDNLGNIYIRKRDMKNAIIVLQAGVAANDPDSMVTLSNLIEIGYLPVPNRVAAKYALLEKAAQLGHSGAQVALQQSRQQRAYQQQEQQMMLDMFRTILQSVPR